MFYQFLLKFIISGVSHVEKVILKVRQKKIPQQNY